MCELVLQRRVHLLWPPNIKPSSQAKETDLWDEEDRKGHLALCSLCYQAGRERTRELALNRTTPFNSLRVLHHHPPLWTAYCTLKDEKAF